MRFFAFFFGLGLLLARARAYTDEEAVKLLRSIGCKSDSETKRVDIFMEDHYLVKAKKNPFWNTFDVPLTFPDPSKEGQNIQFTVYRLAKESQTERDAQIDVLAQKKREFDAIQAKLGYLADFGVQKVLGCHFRQRKRGLFRTLSEVSHVLFEEEPLGTLVRASATDWKQFAYIADQMVQIYTRLEQKGVTFGQVSVDDFWMRKLSGNFFKLMVRWEGLRADIPNDAAEVFLKPERTPSPRYLYEYPGSMVRKIVETQTIAKRDFGVSLSRWRLASSILELAEVDIKATFGSSLCPSIDVEEDCLGNLTGQASSNLEMRYSSSSSNQGVMAVWAVERLIWNLASQYSLESSMVAIAAEFSRSLHS